MPEASSPESLPWVAPHLAESDASTQGRWSSLRWFERRIIDTEVAPPARALMWWRPDGEVPDDPVLTASLVVARSGGVVGLASLRRVVTEQRWLAGAGEWHDVQSQWRTGVHGTTRDVLPGAHILKPQPLQINLPDGNGASEPLAPWNSASVVASS